MKYGYIGLGNLGGHLAMSLIRNGFEVVVNDIDRKLGERHVAAGATWADSPQALAAQVDHVFTCLPSPVVSERVLIQILETLKPGSTWLENSTNGRDEMIRLSKMAEAKGVRTLECPVTGGVHLAARGEITVLVGGESELFEFHRKALQSIGKKIFHMGPVGSAAIIKVITNMLAFIHLVADAEALMQKHQIRRIPVVDGGGKPVGIVSMNDRTAPEVERDATCPYEGRVLEYYDGYFESVFVLLHPFIRPESIAISLFTPETYPEKADLLAGCSGVPWRDVLSAVSFKTLSEIDIALAQSCGISTATCDLHALQSRTANLRAEIDSGGPFQKNHKIALRFDVDIPNRNILFGGNRFSFLTARAINPPFVRRID